MAANEPEDCSTFFMCPSVLEWVQEALAEDFSEYLRLSSEDGPIADPYRSLYAARDRLAAVMAKLSDPPSAVKKAHDDHMVLRMSALVQSGLNHLNTDQDSKACQDFESVTDLSRLSDKRKALFVEILALNQLAAIRYQRAEHEKALSLLLEAKEAYGSGSCSPCPANDREWLLGELKQEEDRRVDFEMLHTHTLFYLAQIYNHLQEAELAAEHCQSTLSRQMSLGQYDQVEWALNAATLSQYYINKDCYRQARHCLMGAAKVMLTAPRQDAEMSEKVRRGEADIQRCWIKYSLSLLRRSCDLMNSNEGVPLSVDDLLLKFDSLDINEAEGEISCQLATDFLSAKLIFLYGQKCVETAKEYFTLESHASDYSAIILDHSELYKTLIVFESDVGVQCRMHKRRIDMLVPLLYCLSRQHYLDQVRQVEFHAALVHSEMADLKVVLSGDMDEPSLHAINKINKLLQSAIDHYQHFVDSYSEPVEPPHLRTYLLARLYIARCQSKFITSILANQVRHLRSSLQEYKQLTQYCLDHADSLAGVFDEELKLCQEMVELLPLKIEKLVD